MKIAFPQYTWSNVLRRDGFAVRSSQIIGFSKWDEERREYLIQGERSFYRILLRGPQPIDEAADLAQVLELSKPRGYEQLLSRLFLHPGRRRFLSTALVLGFTLLLMANFIYRVFNLEYRELVSFPLAALPLIAVPLVFIVSVFFQRQTRF